MTSNPNDQLNLDDNPFQNVSEINDWISNKLNQLTVKNQLLTEENKKVNEQLIKLKERYVKKSFTPEPRRKFYKRNHYKKSRFVDTSSSSSSDDSSLNYNLVLSNTNDKNRRNNRNNNQVVQRNYRLTSKSSSLDRRHSKLKKNNNNNNFNFNKVKKQNHYCKNNNNNNNDDDDDVDVDVDGENSLTFVTLNKSNDNGFKNHQHSANNKPPTPPLHRFPSWESRIYEIANNGIQSTISTPVQGKKLFNTNYEQLKFTDLNTTTNHSSSPILFENIRFTNSTDTIMNYLDNKILPVNIGSEMDPKLLLKSSTTSSGNESDTTNDFNKCSTHFYNHNNNNNSISNISNNNNNNNNDISPHLITDFDNKFSLNACRDSLEKLKITSKHLFTNQITSELFNENNKLEKSGFMFKLSGKFKVWKKRWFVLKDGELIYFKRENDLNNRTMATATAPRGKILLDQNCSLIRSKEFSFHLSYQDGKKNLHLSCDSIQSYNEWLKAIGQTLTINNILKLQDNQVPIIENYIIKVRFGHSLKCWTALYNHHLVYFNNPFEKIPIGYTSLKDCTFQEITTVPDFDDVALIYDDIKKNIHYSISVHPKGNSEPIYLLFLTKQDFSLWYYHLKLAFAENNVPKTSFENILTTLLNLESNIKIKEEFYSHEIWNNPLLTYSGDDITEPLISLYNNDLKNEAFKLFKSIKLFISVPIDLSAIDYHVTLVQNCLQVCFDNPELQAELYYQLIKQSTPNNHNDYKYSTINANQRTFWCSPHSLFKCESASPTEKSADGHLLPENDSILKQCLQFLSITISIFSPQNQVLWLLKHHINRFKDSSTEIGKYILYCERALSRVLLNGSRKRIPSRMEVLSIIQRNPYQHSMPHSIPVHFANNSYQVIGFDGSTTIYEFIKLINSESGIRDNYYSGFALYSDDPVEKDVEHLLELNAKLADAISYWESTMRKYNLGKFENTKIIKLTYKHRLCLKKYFKNETDKERLLWIYEINNEVINNRFPVTFDLAIELMSLMIQIEYGNFKNYKNVEQIMKQALPKFLPAKYHEFNSLNDILLKRWSELDERSILDCVRIYLNCTRKWNLCGCKLFEAKITNTLKYDDLITLYLYKFFLQYPILWIVLTEDDLELLDHEYFRTIIRIPYKNLINFGYTKTYFNLIIENDCLNELISFNQNSTLLNNNNGSNSSSSGGHNRNSQRLLFTLTEHNNIQLATMISDYVRLKKN